MKKILSILGTATLLILLTSLPAVAYVVVKNQTILLNNLWISGTSPTISSGFGGAAAYVSGVNGTGAFQIVTGASTTASGVIGLPAAATGWNCFGNYNSAASGVVFAQSASTTTSATMYDFYAASAAALPASSVIGFSCFAY